MRSLWIDAYLNRPLTRDAASVPGGSSPGRFGAILRLLAANQSGELVKARLAQAAGPSESMVSSHLDALSSVYLIDRLPPWACDLTRRETGWHKVSIIDSALAMHLTSQSAASLLPPEKDALGPLLEGFVLKAAPGDRLIADIVLRTAPERCQFADRLRGMPTPTLWSHCLGSRAHQRS